MSNYYNKLLGMFARTRSDPAAAKILGSQTTKTENNQIGGQVSTRANPQIVTNEETVTSKNTNAETPQNKVTNSETAESEVTENKVKRIRPDSPILFDNETLIAENNSLEAYIVKSYLKRQLRFK
jgi:hypothetical protein